MTRRGLSIAVGVVGTIVAALTLLLLLVMGSVFADARTEHIVGPGVDVFLRTPFPGEGGTISLDVEARGGSRAGVGMIRVSAGTTEIAIKAGHGATWGSYISGSKSRGSDTETVTFHAPAHYRAGDGMPLTISIDYVVAMSTNGTFSNDAKHDTVMLDVKIYSSSGRRIAQLSRTGLALGCFFAWFLLVLGLVKLYAKAEQNDGRHNGELEGIGLLMGFMGGSVLGYWLFAWRVMNALELRSNGWAFLLMLVWCVAPLWFARRWWKRRGNNPSDLPAARVITR